MDLLARAAQINILYQYGIQAKFSLTISIYLIKHLMRPPYANLEIHKTNIYLVFMVREFGQLQVMNEELHFQAE